MIRRARGYSPGVVAHVPHHRPLLAVGADLKNAIALAIDGEVVISQHIGDLGDWDTERAFRETVEDLLSMYRVPVAGLTVIHDQHPEYVSTGFAARLPAAARQGVQHHRAHVASVLAEHGEWQLRVIGVACDGIGYGDDGSIWGGEFFLGSLERGFQRLAHLHPAVLPGSDAAARFPIQAAAGFLADVETPDLSLPPFGFPKRFGLARQLVLKRTRCYPTTSIGRLFDTVAALCGFTREVTFEGQAAMWLEHLARQSRSTSPRDYPFPGLDYRPLLARIIAERQAERDVREIAHAFHLAMADAIAVKAFELAVEHHAEAFVFSGGVFQNRLLCSLLRQSLTQMASLPILTNRVVPCNDGGIALGQIALAAIHTATSCSLRM